MRTRLSAKIENEITKSRCTICLEYVRTPVTVCCNLKFHKKCLRAWCRISRKCPVCKKIVEKDDCEDEDYVEVEKSMENNINRYIKRSS